jgi:Fic family protein
MNISAWIKWFISITLEAQVHAEKMILFTIDKMKFFDQYENKLNERQKKVINKMMEEGPKEFIGGMNAKKYMSITGVSKATATRDLQELVQLNIFSGLGSARSTRYSLNIK